MSRSLLNHFFALALMALWLAPQASALALGLHVATDHRTLRAEKHDLSIAELARDAVHGHHHDVAASMTHEHPATIHGPSRPPRLNSNSMDEILPTKASTVGLTERSGALTSPAQRGQPPQLFTIHCSLLI